MPLDPVRFPRLSAWLAALPAGLDSHPTYQAKGTMLRVFVPQARAAEAKAAGLPAPIEALLCTPPPNSVWIPEAHTWALIFAVADLDRVGEADWPAWVRRKNLELYTNPVMRLVMNLTSPKLALGLSQAYWGVIHRGTALKTMESTGNSARVTLEFPDRLFDERVARMLGISFEVALELSRAKKPAVRFEAWTPTTATWSANWE